MINVSNEFKSTMQMRSDFKENAVVTLTDGTVLNLSESDFTIANNTISDAAGENTLPLGVAVSRSIQIELMNDDDHLSAYDFFGAVIRLYLTFQLSDTVERIEMGTFTVITPETYGETVIITANDDMYKADRPFQTALSFPSTTQELLRDVCSRCGISLASTSFTNDIFTVNSAPSSDLTFRQVIGYIAMIAGGNARINRSGYLEIIPYSFDFDSTPYHTLAEWKNLKTSINSITITGIQTIREIETGDEDGKTEEQTLLNGEEGYVISVENPLAKGREESFLSYLGTVLIGSEFWKFDGDHIAYPIAEFMDLVEITDRKGKKYRSVITDINFQFFGFTALKNSAESGIRNDSTYSAPSQKAIIAARRLIQQEASSREKAIKKLNEALETASGMFTTEEVQPDGSVITFWHDKPTLEESKNVIKITADAIGASTDGGKTYPYGVTVNGETIMRIIQAEGISAEWIKIGSTTIIESINNLQDQIDGAIETWFYDYQPTISNSPASGWTTGEEKNKHLGDLFYIVDNAEIGGLVYRWAMIDGEYTWQLVEDAEVAKALSAAHEAQESVNAVKSEITQIKTDFEVSNNSIIASIEETKTAMNTATDNIYDEISGLRDECVSQTQLEEVKSTVLQLSSDNMELRFQQVKSLIDQLGGTVEDNQRLLEEYIRFEGARMILGRSDSVITAVLQNDRLSFLEDGQEVAYISNLTLYVTDVHILRRLRLGNEEVGYYDWELGETGTLDEVYREA